MDLLGKTIGRFELTSEIGRGGMGVVYVGIDQFLRRSVAIKLISPDVAQSQDAVERFFREARAVARLDHPNIVRIYEAGELEGYPFIAMELVRGQNARAVIAEKPPLPKKLDIMAQVLDGLAHAHAHGVIHRDMKPANILVDGLGVAKIIDFGLARLTDDNRDLTRGQVFGSVCYMAPEQILDPRGVDWRVDIYAAGIILFQFLADRVPFLGKSLPETLSRIVQEPFVFPDHSELDVPDELGEIVRQCLEKDRNLRPQSAREVAERLRWLSRQFGEGETVVEAPLRTGPTRATLPPEPLPADSNTLLDGVSETAVGGLPSPSRRDLSAGLDRDPAPLSPETRPVVPELGDYQLSSEIEAPEPSARTARRLPGPIARHPYLFGALLGLLILTVALPVLLTLRKSQEAGPAGPSEPLSTPAPATPSVSPTSPGPEPAVQPVPLAALTPAPGVLSISVRSGEEFRFEVRSPGPQSRLTWRVNDEQTGTGAEFRYRAGKAGFKDLISVTAESPGRPDPETLIWYVNVY